MEIKKNIGTTDTQEPTEQSKSTKTIGQKIGGAGRSMMFGLATMGGFIGSFDPTGQAQTMQVDEKVQEYSDWQDVQNEKIQRERETGTRVRNEPQITGGAGAPPKDLRYRAADGTVYRVKPDFQRSEGVPQKIKNEQQGMASDQAKQDEKKYDEYGVEIKSNRANGSEEQSINKNRYNGISR